MTLPDQQLVLRASLQPTLLPWVRFVLSRSDLLDRLGAISSPDDFVVAACEIAASNGLNLDAPSLEAALRPDPLGLGRFAPAPLEMDGWPPAGWLPTRSVPDGDELAFDWLWFGARALDAPFFEDEVRRASALPLNWLLRIRTDHAALVNGAACNPAVPPAGLIFHMSRCGSTLMAQMLAALPGHQVSSEPEPLDAVLRWSMQEGIAPETATSTIRAIVSALGRHRGGDRKAHFIKLEVWHGLFLPQLRCAFPATNWIYLHRDPAEVLVSLAAQPSMHVLPGAFSPALLAVDPASLAGPDDHTAMVLSRFGTAIIDHWDLGGGMVIDYPDIPTAATDTIAAHFGLKLSELDVSLMRSVATRDAKSPGTRFSSDSIAKQAAAHEAIRLAAGRWLAPLRNKLILLQRDSGMPQPNTDI